MRPHCILIAATASSLLAVGSVAQDKPVEAKIDTVLANQKKMMETQEKIYEEVRPDEPLAKKTFGIELNIPRVLSSANADHNFLSLSAGFSLFAVDRGAEIAFPVLYQNGQNDKDPLTLLNLDVTYRKFLGRHQEGFYLAGGARYTSISGVESQPFSFFGYTAPTVPASQSKFGVYFGIGYRYFSTTGLYWGTSLVYGTYFVNNPPLIKGVIGDDTKTIIDIELLKFGIAF